MYLSIDNAQSDRLTITKLQRENLFGKLASLEQNLEHCWKLKKRWICVKNLLHYLEYPVSALMIGGDVLLFATGVSAPIAKALSRLTSA